MDVDQPTLDGTRPTSCSGCAEMTASKWPLAACDRGIIQQGEPLNRSTDALATITSEHVSHSRKVAAREGRAIAPLFRLKVANDVRECLHAGCRPI
jgi:hypothetical protein